MSIEHDLKALADICGILPNFYDLQGNLTPTSPETQKALLTGNGIDVSSDEAIRTSLAALRNETDDRWFPHEIIVESGQYAAQNFGLGATWQLRLDEDDKIIATGEPSDFITVPPLASGVYALTATASGRTEVVTVIATPKRLPLIDKLSGINKIWGLNLALYGLRSQRNSGLGDFEDLAQVASVAGSKGAGFLGINPVHTMGHADQEAISPYSPSHRGFLNTTCIALDQVNGFDDTIKTAQFTDIRESKTVDYQSHKAAHTQVLEALFKRFDKKTSPEFANFANESGSKLVDFATFEALSEIHGPDWRNWPDKRDAPSEERIEFHIWLQWIATTQLASAQARAKANGMTLGLYLDLAVGSRRGGAESWCARSAIAQGVSVGAPPDHLSPAGQNWDLAAFAPRKLQAQRYRPLRHIISQTIRHAGVIRIDHVLGLFRSFWIPDDGSPGGYIRQPLESLIAVIKIEAERHNCAVIGEDLGLVPNGFRETMRAHGFYGYSVLQYEKDENGAFRDPETGEHQVLSCFATHDTPTLKGYETGRDIEWWEQLSWIDAEAAQALRDQRANEVASFKGDGTFETGVHGRLAYSNASLVTVQLDDILGIIEAQNLPGTINEHPNWRRKYDTPLETLAENTALNDTATLMKNAGR